jgi:heat shock protein 1/8
VPFHVKQSESNKPLLEGGGRTFLPEELSAIILRDMKRLVQEASLRPCTNAVITVPAYFTDMQRQATRRAGELAGLHVLRIINEPTAAAIAYGLDRALESTVLVFDLGGGTLDTSILNIDNGVFEVLATAGDTHLGGEDFTDNCVAYFAPPGLAGRDRARLKCACEYAKKTLSTADSTFIDIEISGQEFHRKLTRTLFEELNVDLFERCMALVRRCLTDARKTVSDIDEVVLVGGATRMPRIRARLEEMFGKPPNTSVHPDEAVAQGAAIQAAVLGGVKSERLGEMLLLDVTPISLGIEVLGGVMEVIIPRNSTIPTRRTKMFTNYLNDQTSMVVDVYEGERTYISANRHLAQLEITGIPPAKSRSLKLLISFEINADGILSVSAEEKVTRAKESIIVRNRGTYTKNEIAEIIENSKKFQKEDSSLKERMQAKLALEEKVVFSRRFMFNISGLTSAQKDLINETIDKIDKLFEKFDVPPTGLIRKLDIELEAILQSCHRHLSEQVQ